MNLIAGVPSGRLLTTAGANKTNRTVRTPAHNRHIVFKFGKRRSAEVTIFVNMMICPACIEMGSGLTTASLLLFAGSLKLR
jgi:hypothetical protein